VFAGALIAAAVSLVLLTFGSAIGLAVTPLTNSWRISTPLLGALSGFWVVVVSVGAMAAGGYVAGRMRATWHVAHDDVVEFRDGTHGLVVWALAVTLGAILSAATATALLAGAAGMAAADRDANTTKPVSVAYEVDRLFRSEAASIIPAADVRDEAGRLLMSASRGRAGSDQDQAQLAALVADTERIAPAAAAARVNESVASIKDKVAAARRAAIILAFVTAAALAVGAAAAWQAACVGGRHRDCAAPPSLAWRRSRGVARRS
jgi:hypothetical protein